MASPFRRPVLVCPALCTLLLLCAGCAHDVAVKKVAPPRAAAIGTPAAPDPGAVAASLRTLRSPAPAGDRQAAAANLIDLYGPALLAAPGHTLTIPAGSTPPGPPQRLTLRRGTGPGGVDPAQFTTLQPTDRFRVIEHRPSVVEAGVGVSLVGSLRPLMPVHAPEPAPAQPVTGGMRAITAVPVFSRNELCFELYDPHVTDRDATGARLAADFTTSEALVYSRIARQNRGIHGFISGSSAYASAGIYPTSEPCTDKTPVVLVHGLISDPTDFYELHAALKSDPEFRRRYQVWSFYYPSSLPIPSSAMMLRDDFEFFVHQLDPHGIHPALHRAVLIGHSMGGLLCRLAVSDGGEAFYHHFFNKPLSELDLTADQRVLVRGALYFHACPDVSKVVFISTPHRGSKLAGGWLGKLGQLLVRVPVAVRRTIHNVASNNRDALVSKNALRPASSLETLTPDDPLILALKDAPIRPGVQLHSILGNLRRGVPLQETSDGVVPYASSHLPGAQSEILVPAGHTGTLNRPETAAEITRILDAHG